MTSKPLFCSATAMIHLAALAISACDDEGSGGSDVDNPTL